MVSYELVLRGGSIVSASGVVRADIAVEGGKIVKVGDLGSASSKNESDITGRHVLPGVIDTQVHFREPGAEHKEDLESGTRAAICGGVTTIFEMPNTAPPTTSAEALADKLRRAAGRAWCDYAFFIGASKDNIDRLPDLETLPGTPGIKIFMGSSTGSLLVDDDESLARVLRSGKLRCSVHAEHEPRLRERLILSRPETTVSWHPFIRDAEAAALATKRLLRFAEEAGRPVHLLHVSTGDEIPLLRQARARGVDVSAEITPQHLYFSAPAAYEKLGTLAQMNPPIREEYHRQSLLAGLAEGSFDIFGSDHAPHTLEEKALPYLAKPGSPSGLPGVQTMLPVLLDFVEKGLLDLPKLVQMTSARPAELFGISGKGRIEEGFDADMVVVAKGKTNVLTRDQVQSKCGWSPFEGDRIGAFPEAVYLRGTLVSENGRPVGSPKGSPAAFIR